MICRSLLMKENKRKLVIFDLDDTIYPESMYNLACYKASSECVYKDYGIDIYPEIERRFNNGEYRDLFNKALKDKGLFLNESYIRSKLLAAYRSYKPDLRPYAGFLNEIEKLKRNYKLAIITDGNINIQRHKIESLSIKKYFEYILCSSELGDGISKPMAQPYEKVLSHFNILANDAVYIGDNIEKDFIYPMSCGMHSILLKNLEENNNLIYKNEIGKVPPNVCFSYNELIETLAVIFKGVECE